MGAGGCPPGVGLTLEASGPGQGSDDSHLSVCLSVRDARKGRDPPTKPVPQPRSRSLGRVTSGVVGKWLLHPLILNFCGLNSLKSGCKKRIGYPPKYKLHSVIMELFHPNRGLTFSFNLPIALIQHVRLTHMP